MARRPPKEQSKHDETVRREAKKYKRQGWKVKADLPEYDRPDPIGKKNPRRPDIVATKPGTRHIVEVETDAGADKKQRETFRRSAGQRNRTVYREIFTDGSA
ncbi:MAG: hypothetical protein WD490_02485 [Opitutales bacterium]